MLILPRRNSIRIPLVLSLAAASFAGLCDQPIVDCIDNSGDEVRVHIENVDMTANVGVELVSPDEICSINPLPTAPGEFGQVVMRAIAGTPITITASATPGGTSARTCNVDASAFLNPPPGSDNGQVFASVRTVPSLSVTCDSGFQ